MENTFWHRDNCSGDSNFVKLFKKSFKLYVESGTRKKIEAAINILLINAQGASRVTEDFKEKFYMTITEHYLRKIHCFYFHLTHLTTFFA
jgi:hypothetical protein